MMFRRHLTSPHRGLGSDPLTAIWGRMGLLVPFAENGCAHLVPSSFEDVRS